MRSAKNNEPPEDTGGVIDLSIAGESKLPRWAEALVIFVVGLILALAFLSPARAAPPKACEGYRGVMLSVYAPSAAAVYVGQVVQESACDGEAVSPAGAQGLAQFMPLTARDVAERNSALSPPLPFSPEWAVRAQVYYMTQQKRRLRGDGECEDWAMALAAYNSGAGWVLRAKRRAAREGKSPYRWWGNVEATPDRRHSRAAVRENRHYVRVILRRRAPAAARAWRLSPSPCE